MIMFHKSSGIFWDIFTSTYTFGVIFMNGSIRVFINGRQIKYMGYYRLYVLGYDVVYVLGLQEIFNAE
jgi:hypothetical protein